MADKLEVWKHICLYSFRTSLQCVKCSADGQYSVVILDCLHVVCYSRERDCLKEIGAERDNKVYYECKACHHQTSKDILEQRGCLNRQSDTHKRHNAYIYAARRICNYDDREKDGVIMKRFPCDSTKPADTEDNRSRLKKLLDRLLTAKTFRPPRKHDFCDSASAVYRLGCDPIEHYCNLRCAKHRAVELQAKIEVVGYTHKDWCDDGIALCLSILNLKYRSIEFDQRSDEIKAQVVSRYALLDKMVVRYTAATVSELQMKLESSKRRSPEEIEPLRQALATEKQKLSTMIVLGRHLILQIYMLYESNSEVKSMLEEQEDCNRFDPAWYFKNYQPYTVCDMSYLFLKNRCPNYRMIDDSNVLHFFPGIGEPQTNDQVPDDSVQLIVKKDECSCSTLEKALSGRTNKGYYDDSGISYILKKQHSDMDQHSRTWRNTGAGPGNEVHNTAFSKISDDMCVRNTCITTKDETGELQLIKTSNNDVIEGFDLFQNSRSYGRGIWYFVDDFFCCVYTLEINSRNVIVWDLTSECKSIQKPTYLARKTVIEVETIRNRKFREEDTLVVTRYKDEIKLFICFCTYNNSEKKAPPEFFHLYTIKGDKAVLYLQYDAKLPVVDKRTDTNEAFQAGIARPVLLGAGKLGTKLLFLDELDDTWLHLMCESRHEDINTKSTKQCHEGWMKLQIKQPSGDPYHIYDAFLVYNQNDDTVFLHFFTPEENAAASGRVLCYKLNITHLVDTVDSWLRKQQLKRIPFPRASFSNPSKKRLSMSKSIRRNTAA